LEKQPFLLINKIQNYAWGSKNDEAFIPQLLDITTEPDLPYAELWIGTHPKACSEILFEGNKIELLSFINKNPEEILGNFCINKFGAKFPYLLKVLSAAEALSIQAHPNKKYAEILHKKDPFNYPDDNHKPEIAVALDNLTALAGFRDIQDIIKMLNEYNEISEFLELDILPDIKELKEEEIKKALKNIFEKLLNNAVEKPGKLKECIESLIKKVSVKIPNLNEKEKLFIELSSKNPSDDIGLLVIFFLELIHLNSGEAFFTGAGIPHAYIKGNIVECMANSDNVVRAGLTNKFKDITTLSEIAYYNTEPIEILKNDPGAKNLLYNSPAEEFKISKIELEADSEIEISTENSFEVLLVTEGEIKIKSSEFNSGKEFDYKKGNSILIAAFINKYILSAKNKITVFRVTVN